MYGVPRTKYAAGTGTGFGLRLPLRPQGGGFEFREKRNGDRPADRIHFRNRPPRCVRLVDDDGEGLHVGALKPQGFDLPRVRPQGIYGKNVHVSLVDTKIKGYRTTRRLHDGKTFRFRFGKKASKRQRRPCDIFLAIAIHRAVLVGRQGYELCQSQQISGAGFLGSFARRNHLDETGRVKNHARSPEDTQKTVPCGLLLKAHAKSKQRVQIETIVKEANLSIEHLNISFQRRVPADPKRCLQLMDDGSVPGRDLPHFRAKIFQINHDEVVGWRGPEVNGFSGASNNNELPLILRSDEL